MSKAAELAALIGSQTALSNRNLIINGAMNINQRGTQTGVYTNTYGVDRFGLGGSGSQRLTYSQSTTVPSGQGFSHSLKLDVTTADTSVAASDYEILTQRIEGQDLQHLKYGTSGAKSLTLQFWVKSPKTGIHIAEIQNADAGYINPQPYTIASANTWQKVELTFDGYQTTGITNDNGARFLVNWWLMAGSNYSSGTLTANTWHNTTANRAVGQVNVMDSTSNEFYITGVQLEIGEQATAFEHRSIEDELARCQRYYCQIVGGGEGSAANKNIANASFYTSSYVQGILQLPVTMRANPSLVHTTGSGYYGMIAGYAANTFNNFILDSFSHRNAVAIYNSGSISGTQGDGGFLYAANASAALGFDAEL